MAEPILPMAMEELQRSLPNDEGFRLCSEVMRAYLAVLSPEERFRMNLDWGWETCISKF